MNDSLTIRDVESSILNGQILEEYPDTGRGESVLIAGRTVSGTPVHVVYGRRGDYGVMVTVYIPGPPKFVDPFHRSG